jgi:hypothetical protein
MRKIYTILLFLIVNSSLAQKLSIKNFQLSFSILERERFANNPETISPLIEDKASYQNSIDSFLSNGFYGAPGPEKVKSWQIAVELSTKNRNSFFGRHMAIKLGFGIANKIRKDHIGLDYRNYQIIDSVNNIFYKSQYDIVHNSRQAGLLVALTYRTKIFNHVQFTTGLVFQPNITLYSKFERQVSYDTLYTPGNIKTSRSAPLPTLKGVSIFTYNIYVPLGLEINAYKQKVFFRAVLNAGFLHSRYYQLTSKKNECNGVELGIIYQPK